MLTLHCPNCAQALNLLEKHLGVKGRCLKCREAIVAQRCGEDSQKVVLRVVASDLQQENTASGELPGASGESSVSEPSDTLSQAIEIGVPEQKMQMDRVEAPIADGTAKVSPSDGLEEISLWPGDPGSAFSLEDPSSVEAESQSSAPKWSSEFPNGDPAVSEQTTSIFDETGSRPIDLSGDLPAESDLESVSESNWTPDWNALFGEQTASDEFGGVTEEKKLADSTAADLPEESLGDELEQARSENSESQIAGEEVGFPIEAPTDWISEVDEEADETAAHEQENSPPAGLTRSRTASDTQSATEASPEQTGFEWTPFEFASVEETDFSPIVMDQPAPQNPAPQNPAPEPTTPTGGLSASDPEPSDSPDSSAEVPKRVKKSALPPLAGIGGLASFPRAEKVADGADGADGAEGTARRTPLTSLTPLSLEEDGDDHDSEAQAESGSEEVAASGSSIFADLSADPIETVADSAGNDDNDRSDALARFAARIDSVALAKSEQKGEAENSSSEEVASGEVGSLPWEKPSAGAAGPNAPATPRATAAAAEDSKRADSAAGPDAAPPSKGKEAKPVEYVSSITEAEIAATAMRIAGISGSGRGEGGALSNHARDKRLRKKRRRRIALVVLLMMAGGVVALMHYKPGLKPASLKASVLIAFNEAKKQVKTKDVDLDKILAPLKAAWGMEEVGGSKETPKDTEVVGSAPVVKTPNPVQPKTSPGPAPAPARAPASGSSQIAVMIPPKTKAPAPGTVPIAAPHAAGAAPSASLDGRVRDPEDPVQLTHPMPGETPDQLSMRIGGEQLLKDFYAARTAEAKLTFILEANAVAGEVEEAFPNPVDVPSIRSMDFKGRLVDSGTGRPFGVFDVRENENGDRHRWCVPEVTTGNFKIDWGLYRQLADDELTRFLADPDSPPKTMRLLIRRGPEVASEQSPWHEPSFEMHVLMPLDDGSPSSLLMKRSAHDDLGLNRALGDGVARVGKVRIAWEPGISEGSTAGAASPTIVDLEAWGAWQNADAKQSTATTADPDPSPVGN